MMTKETSRISLCNIVNNIMWINDTESQKLVTNHGYKDTFVEYVDTVTNWEKENE